MPMVGKVCRLRETTAASYSLGILLRTNVQIYQEVVDFQKLITQIPGQVLHEQPVLFWDARGRFAPSHLEFINCPEVSDFHFPSPALAESYIGSVGNPQSSLKGFNLKRIEHGQFALTDANTNHDLDLSQQWARCFRVSSTT